MIKARRKLYEAITVDPETRKAVQHFVFLAYDHEDARHQSLNQPGSGLGREVHIREFSPTTNPLYQTDASQRSDDESDQQTV